MESILKDNTSHKIIILVMNEAIRIIGDYMKYNQYEIYKLIK